MTNKIVVYGDITQVKRVMKTFCPKSKKSKLNFEIDVEEVPTDKIKSLLEYENSKKSPLNFNFTDWSRTKVIRYTPKEPLYKITIYYDKQKEIEKLEQMIQDIELQLLELKNDSIY
jgi:hypothetical protein